MTFLWDAQQEEEMVKVWEEVKLYARSPSPPPSFYSRHGNHRVSAARMCQWTHTSFPVAPELISHFLCTRREIKASLADINMSLLYFSCCPTMDILLVLTLMQNLKCVKRRSCEWDEAWMWSFQQIKSISLSHRRLWKTTQPLTHQPVSFSAKSTADYSHDAGFLTMFLLYQSIILNIEWMFNVVVVILNYYSIIVHFFPIQTIVKFAVMCFYICNSWLWWILIHKLGVAQKKSLHKNLNKFSELFSSGAELFEMSSWDKVGRIW